MTDEPKTAHDSLAAPHRKARELGVEIPELKYPEGATTTFCTCALYAAPEDRPVEQCPMHGWEITQRRFPVTDSAQEARELRD